MNIWNVLKELHCNPHKKFKLINGNAILETDKNGNIDLSDIDYLNMEDNWIEIEVPEKDIKVAIAKSNKLKVKHKLIPKDLSQEITGYHTLSFILSTLISRLNDSEVVEIINNGDWFIDKDYNEKKEN